MSVTSLYGMIQGKIEMLGINAILKNKPAMTGKVTNYLLQKTMERIPGSKTLLSFSKALSYEAKTFAGRVGLGITSAGIKEFETGLLQNIAADRTYGYFVNTVLDSEMFAQPEDFIEGVKQLTYAGAAEGIGGLLFGAGNVMVQTVKTGNFTNISPEQWSVFEAMTMDNNLLEDYKNNLRYRVYTGK